MGTVHFDGIPLIPAGNWHCRAGTQPGGGTFRITATEKNDIILHKPAVLRFTEERLRGSNRTFSLNNVIVTDISRESESGLHVLKLADLRWFLQFGGVSGNYNIRRTDYFLRDTDDYESIFQTETLNDNAFPWRLSEITTDLLRQAGDNCPHLRWRINIATDPAVYDLRTAGMSPGDALNELLRRFPQGAYVLRQNSDGFIVLEEQTKGEMSADVDRYRERFVSRDIHQSASLSREVVVKFPKAFYNQTTSWTCVMPTDEEFSAGGATWREGEYVPLNTLLSHWGYAEADALAEALSFYPFASVPPVSPANDAEKAQKQRRREILKRHFQRTFRVDESMPLPLAADELLRARGSFYVSVDEAGEIDDSWYRNMTDTAITVPIRIIDHNRGIITFDGPVGQMYGIFLEDEDIKTLCEGTLSRTFSGSQATLGVTGLARPAGEFHEMSITNKYATGQTVQHWRGFEAAVFDESGNLLNESYVQEEYETIRSLYSRRFSAQCSGSVLIAGLTEASLARTCDITCRCDDGIWFTEAKLRT